MPPPSFPLSAKQLTFNRLRQLCPSYQGLSDITLAGGLSVANLVASNLPILCGWRRWLPVNHNTLEKTSLKGKDEIRQKLGSQLLCIMTLSLKRRRIKAVGCSEFYYFITTQKYFLINPPSPPMIKLGDYICKQYTLGP